MLLFRVLGLRQRHNRWHIRVLPSLADKLGIHLLVFVGLAVDAASRFSRVDYTTGVSRLRFGVPPSWRITCS